VTEWPQCSTIGGVKKDRSRPLDLTVVAVPLYFGGMVAEHLWLRRRAAKQGTAGDYERRDTLTSLAMGAGSLLVPLTIPRLLGPFTPGRGRFGRSVIAVGLGAVALTTAADVVGRRLDDHDDGAEPDATDTAGSPDGRPGRLPVGRRERRRMVGRSARKFASVGGVVAIAVGGVAATTTLSSRMTLEGMWRRRVLPALGTGPVALALAIAGWDFIYYWNHRLMHETRYMWAIHVVHHSSEHYNLSTALRQPVADAFGTFLPYGLLCLFGIRPELVTTARGVNLLYQFWIHTETINRLGPTEAVLNTPSHHRVHHGSNRQYLDRNHGSILIVWDRLFGTFEPEAQPVVYGLTKNINSFNLGRVVTHEYSDMLRDIARSDNWGDRLSFVLRGPGWAAQHRHDGPGASVSTGTTSVRGLSERDEGQSMRATSAAVI